MWSRQLLKAKTQAWLIHLGVSAVVFLPFLYLLWKVWFPPPFFFTDGGWQGLRIMLPVDFVIGPTLTFLVFNPAKPRRETLIELTVIGMIQGAALAYGGAAVESRRVVAASFAGQAFVPISKDIAVKQGAKAPDWERLGPGPVRWAVWEPAETEADAHRIMDPLVAVGVLPSQAIALLQPLDHDPEALRRGAINLAELKYRNPAWSDRIAAFQAAHPGTLRFYWLAGTFERAVVALDADNHLAGWIRK